MNSANVVAEIQLKLFNERALSTGELCTCEYVTLLQSFHRGTLSIYWYIAQNVQPTFSKSVLFRQSSETAMFSRFLKVAIATSNVMNKDYNGEFVPRVQRFIVKIRHHANLRLCIGNLEIKNKTSGKIYANLKYEIQNLEGPELSEEKNIVFH